MSMFSTIRPHQWVAIRLPSDNIKVEQMIPNATISLGKFGSFKANHVINRPFYITWEILEKSDERPDRVLRAVKANALHAETFLEEAETDLIGDTTGDADLDVDSILDTDKSNVNIFDDPANQKLSTHEIEALKAGGVADPQDVIAKIMASHSTIDQKTAFSLAKYTLRKQKKYMKRFTILPLDVATMVDWMMSDRDFTKVLEIRNELVGLVGSWANIHATGNAPNDQFPTQPESRYLVVDDTGGLIVATIAERMGILHHAPDVKRPPTTDEDEDDIDSEDQQTELRKNKDDELKRGRGENQKSSPTSNTIHLVHSNQQPNLSLLRYFNFDPNITPTFSDPTPAHPLHSHLKSISWLQLLDPEADSACQEPPHKSPEELRTMKANARSSYHRKRRRWERCKTIVDETKAGGFNGLIIATYTNPLSILHHLVPLLAGGAQIVIYHPYVEPLTEVFDAYSTARRTAFLNLDAAEREAQLGSGARFPVDPTLTLGFTVQTARVRKWQVLPGRTHPLMMGRGGAEGYLAVATRVLPIRGKIQARGKSVRKPKRLNGDLETTVVLGNSQPEDDNDNSNSADEDEQHEIKKVKHDVLQDVVQDEVDVLADEAHSAVEDRPT